MPTPYPPLTRQYHWFGYAALGAVLFIILTAIAMLIYDGGTPAEPYRRHYAFFQNFFSDLGRTRSFAGRSNDLPRAFFSSAMVIGALAMFLFFRAFAKITAASGNRNISRHLSHHAALLGIAAAACFVGVACTPWDLYNSAHSMFVVWAFRLFLAAVALNFFAILLEPALPRRAAWVFAAFAIMLAGYLVLLTAHGGASAAIVQATGQKIIVYSAILTVFIQSMHLRTFLRTRHEMHVSNA